MKPVMKPLVKGLSLALALTLAFAAAPGAVEAWKLDPAVAAACPALAAAVAAANATVNSPQGVDCFVNGPLDRGMDPEKFDDDGEGPEIKVEDLSSRKAYGLYRPTTPNVIYVDEQLKVNAEAGNAAAQMVLEATIVHETTHWVDAQDRRDTPGEEGCAMETWIYGFPKLIENAMATWVANPSPAGTLAVQISTPKTMYGVGEPIDVTLTLINQSSGWVTIVGDPTLPSEFLDFDVRGPRGRVDYSGVKVKSRVPEERLVDLAPGETLTQVVRLNAASEGYSMMEKGVYQLTATYEVPDYGTPLHDREVYAGRETSRSIQISVLATATAIERAMRGGRW